MKKVWHYELSNGVVSYVVPSHPITKKQTGNSVYLKQYFKKMSYGVGEKGKYNLSGITVIKPNKSSGRITICDSEGKFIVRAGKDDFDTVVALIKSYEAQ